MNLHQNKAPTWLVHIPGHPWVLGQATGISDHKTHHGPDSGVCHHHTLPIVYSATPHGGYIQIAQIPGTPEMESRNCPEIVPGGVSGLWELITLDCEIGSWRGLNQTCSPRQDLSNDVSHSQFRLREKVDSRLLTVGSQTASLTPGPSFAHNLGDRCPNAQCEGIFDIYASRPFPMTLRTPQYEVFWALLSSSEHSGVPKGSNPSLFPSVGLHPTLGQSRVATPGQFPDSNLGVPRKRAIWM